MQHKLCVLRESAASVQQQDVSSSPSCNNIHLPALALQVANVLRARSAEGLSALSFELESWGLLVHATYGYMRGLPFSAYGEAVMMFAQNVLLLALIYRYARMPASRAMAVAVVAASVVAAVFTGRCQDACRTAWWHVCMQHSCRTHWEGKGQLLVFVSPLWVLLLQAVHAGHLGPLQAGFCTAPAQLRTTAKKSSVSLPSSACNCSVISTWPAPGPALNQHSAQHTAQHSPASCSAWRQSSAPLLLHHRLGWCADPAACQTAGHIPADLAMRAQLL